MNALVQPTVAAHNTMPKTPPRITLVLQGGGALGAYQAGVYEALHEAGLRPDWVIGTSIGAINGSLIAGNMPERRLERLRAFWKRVEHGFVPSILRRSAIRRTATGQLVDDGQWGRRIFHAQPRGIRQPDLAARDWKTPDTTAPAVAAHAVGLGGFRPDQQRRMSPDSRRRECPHRDDALFRQP